MTFFADSEKEPAVSLNFFNNFFAHINSVANIAKPTGITIMAGPGVKNNMHPINTTEAVSYTHLTLPTILLV